MDGNAPIEVIHRATCDYLASLGWIRAQRNLPDHPAGAGQLRVLDFRAPADNSVGRVVDTLRRCVLIICDELGFAPHDDTHCHLRSFRSTAYERRSL